MVHVVEGVLLGLLLLAAGVMITGIFTISAQNAATVKYVRRQFGIRIDRSVAEALNDHRSSKENVVRIDVNRVLVGVEGKPVRLREIR